MIFYGAEFTYAELLHDIERLSGYLQSTLMLKTGEPVLLYLQNSPQFIISYYGILHAGGVVVPVTQCRVMPKLLIYKRIRMRAY